MFKFVLIPVVLFLSGAVPSFANTEADIWNDYDKVLKTLPVDAAKMLDRGVTCSHFTGELNGDDSQRDREVKQEMRKLKCDSVDGEVTVMKKKYKSNGAVQKAVRMYYGN
ncbi:hypothetical protein [Jeongeupia chitinilytica]|uniref:Uncharacterized protein n=1 Tax=Jeongeupia chitinilytica TaxID=1041641 RepID=A0ABQ3H7L6_9NEIS|nr:hypothetical protein [Jeongeupia chitinilytica]GHD68492.1 hypothetical protein GCM10007350_33920 [Jeongeupia chitinilytica]